MLGTYGYCESAVVAALLTERNVKVKSGGHFAALPSGAGPSGHQRNRIPHRPERLFATEQTTDGTRRSRPQQERARRSTTPAWSMPAVLRRWRSRPEHQGRNTREHDPPSGISHAPSASVPEKAKEKGT